MQRMLFLCIFIMSLAGCAARQPVTLLGDDLSPLRAAFNENADQWRAVSLVSPTCSECILGAEAVEKEITAKYTTERVPAIVIWIPMLPSDNEEAARHAATIFPAGRAAQFYDAQQMTGTQYAQKTFAGFYERARRVLPDDHWLAMALDDRIEVKRPQWDLYMLYAPGVTWRDEAPPMPTHWIRHLGRGEDRTTSVYWQDSPESGPRQGDLFEAIGAMARDAIGPLENAGGAMKIEVLGFDGCPNTPQIRANLNAALQQIGIQSHVAYVDQERLPSDDSRRGWPAPTVLIDGRDLFGMPMPAGAAMGCRMYEGGVPSVEKLVEQLQSLRAKG